MSVITIRRGNLFSASKEYSLAHCVSKDLNMGAGIATEFKRRFGRVNSLKLQNKGIGDVALLQLPDGRCIFYLITKLKYWQKPTYANLSRSLHKLRYLCDKHGVARLAMPRIACGIDRLSWSKVKELLTRIFRNSNIKLTVYIQ